MNLKSKIKELSDKYFKEIVAIRQHLHANPELSFIEFETAEFISARLSDYGISHKKKIAGTGIVATVTGTKNSSKNVIALRAEMDALPINEKNNIPYRSSTENIMHACGHDAHAASLLGTAKILNTLKNEFSGTIKFIFQPGEEKFPGGASLMIKEGVLKNPRPASIFAQHVSPELPVGKIGFREGLYMASADELYVTVSGKGGHAAFPKQTINPLLIASEILLALNKEFMRSGLPFPTVLSFGKINAPGATNVIPGELKLEGTFRTMNEKWRVDCHKKMKRIAEKIARSRGGACEFRILKGYPFLINDNRLTANARKFAEKYLGSKNVIRVEQRMGAEDFSYYSQEIPACFYRIGVGNKKKNIVAGLHSPDFNIDESALRISMGFMAWIAINTLTGHKNM